MSKLWPWLAFPILLLAILYLHYVDYAEPYPNPLLTFLLGFVFTTFGGVLIAFLAGRSFLSQSVPNLLMLGCGALILGSGSLVATVIDPKDINSQVTVYNLCVWFSALCHLAGTVIRPRKTTAIRGEAGLWLGLAYLSALLLVWVIRGLTTEGMLPAFFIQGHGGTPLRQMVVISSIGIFALSAALLKRPKPKSAGFSNWYALALTLIATGLFGVLLQQSQASLTGWAGRTAQYVGGACMLIAAAASVRESRAWRLTIESALQETKQQYESLVDLAADGIMIHELASENQNGFIHQANPALCNLLGYTHEELQSMTVLDITVPEDGAGVLKRLQAIPAERALRHEEALLTKGGKRVPVEVSSRQFVRDGRPMAMSIVRDFTERKMTEEKIRESEQRWAITLASIGDAVIATDTGGRVTFLNNVAEELTGWSMAGAVGKPVGEVFRIVNEHTRVPVEDPVSKVLRSGLVVGLANHTVLLRRGGGELAIDDSGAPIRDRDGQTLGVVLVFRDISERRQAEEALRRLSQFPAENPNPVLRISAEGALLYANAPARDWLETLGWQDAGPLPLSVTEFLADAHGHNRPVEGEICNSKGNTFWVTAAHPPGENYINLYAIDITARKQTEVALQQRQKDLDRAQEVGQIGSWRLDVRSNVLIWSDENHRIFGVPKGTPLTYERFLEIVHPDDREYVDLRWKAGLAGEPYDIEHRIIVDEQVKHVREKAFLEFDNGGKLLGGLGITQDITERKRAEEQIERERFLQQLLLDHFPGVALLLRTTTREVVASNRAGREVGAVCGATCFDTWGQSAEPCPWCLAQDLWATGKEQSVVIEAGEKIFEAHWVPVRDDLYMHYALDITEHKLAEKRLQERNQLVQQALSISNSFTFDWDTGTDQVRRSDSCKKIFGIDGVELCNATSKHFCQRVHPDDRARFEKLLHNLTPVADTYTTDFQFVLSDGNVVTLAETGQGFFNAAGKLQRVLGVATDITARKRAEDALKQVNEILEQQVAARTQLAEARTKQLQALAMELIEAEERERQRIAELLHEDLQQILASARIQLQVACKGPQSDPILQRVAQLLEASISKSRRLSHELSPAVLHHSSLFGALQWLVGQMKDEFGLEVRLESDGAKWFESGPLKVFLFRAVQELLFNIVKHAGVKRAHVSLSTSENGLALSVSDRGRGFDIEVLDSYAQTVHFGLLSLRERSRYFGGNLQIESAPGTGSHITLTVPLGAELSQPTDAQVRPIHAGASPSTTLGSIRVLIVDDHHIMRQGLVRLLAGQPDIQIVGEATNGREAIEQVRQFKPSVVVMDVAMPVLNGIEATRQIKAELPDVRVIGLSMHAEADTARAMREAGAEAFVVKTASSAELLRTIYGISGRA